MTSDYADALVVFISYSSKDRNHLKRLVAHLARLREEKKISEWHSQKLCPGDSWDDSIRHQLDEARIFILLITANFMESDYIRSVEVRRALERRHSDGAVVIPVIVSPVDWKVAPFERLQALPAGGKAVTLWKPQDAAWADVAKGLRGVIDRLQEGGGETPSLGTPGG